MCIKSPHHTPEADTMLHVTYISINWGGGVNTFKHQNRYQLVGVFLRGKEEEREKN